MEIMPSPNPHVCQIRASCNHQCTSPYSLPRLQYRSWYASIAPRVFEQRAEYITWKHHRRKYILCSADVPSSTALAACVALAGEMVRDASISLTAAAVPFIYLSSVCCIVVSLQRQRQISEGLCSIVCEVLCNLTIPALLFATTLKAVPHLHPMMLLLLPWIATQVALGWWLGGKTARLVANRALFNGPLLGWHPYSPAASAWAIADSTSRALGTSAAVSALTPKTPGIPGGLQQAVQAACAFGDPLLTPAAMLALMTPSPFPPQVSTWLAAYLAAWSLIYWSAAPFLTAGQVTATIPSVPEWPFSGPALSVPHLLLRINSRMRAVLAAPLPPYQTLPRGTSSRAVVDSEEAAQLLTPTAMYEAQQEDMHPTAAKTVAKRLSCLWQGAARLSSSLVGKAMAMPQMAAIIAGLLLGSTTLCRTALQVDPTHTLHLPWELRMLLVTLRSLLDAAQAVGQTTGPLMAVALGAALFESHSEVQMVADVGSDRSRALVLTAGQTWRSSTSRLPLEPPQLRAALAVVLVRYMALPLAGLLLLVSCSWVLQQLHAHQWGAAMVASCMGPWGPAVAWMLLSALMAPPTELLVAWMGAREGAASQLVGTLAKLSLVWRLLGLSAAAAWGSVFLKIGGFQLL